MAEEQLRKLKLFVVQPHFLESGFQQILTTVQCDISEAERKRSVGVAATGEGADTGKKFVCGKGLGQVIVRPGIQRRDFVFILAARTDHNNGHI